VSVSCGRRKSHDFHYNDAESLKTYLSEYKYPTMKIYKAVFLIVLLLGASTLRAEMSAEKRAAIDELLRLTGMEALMGQMKNQMVAAMKPQMGQVPPEFWDKFVAKLDVSEVLGKVILIYDKYYTLEDIRAVNAFYSSEVGRKILSTLPQVMQESMRAGQEWGEKKGRQAAEETIAELTMERSKKGDKTPEPSTPPAPAPENRGR
jgi:uncharacterized protein